MNKLEFNVDYTSLVKVSEELSLHYKTFKGLLKYGESNGMIFKSGRNYEFNSINDTIAKLGLESVVPLHFEFDFKNPLGENIIGLILKNIKPGMSIKNIEGLIDEIVLLHSFMVRNRHKNTIEFIEGIIKKYRNYNGDYYPKLTDFEQRVINHLNLGALTLPERIKKLSDIKNNTIPLDKLLVGKNVNSKALKKPPTTAWEVLNRLAEKEVIKKIVIPYPEDDKFDFSQVQSASKNTYQKKCSHIILNKKKIKEVYKWDYISRRKIK